MTGDLPVTVSIGVASTEVTTGTASALLADADHSLYTAKHAGRDQVITRTPGQER